MKLIILLSVVAWSSCAKLDRTYLPPSHAQYSAGSSFLQAPNSGFARGSGSRNQPQGTRFATSNDDSSLDNFNQQANFNQNEKFNQQGNFIQNDDFNRGFAADSGNFGDFDRPERPQAAFERNAAILRQDSQNDGETYSYAYETENGIYAEESGVATNGVEAQGSYSYTGDDGQVYTVRYTADQNGFVPIGEHLPTVPPVPEEILKALEQNARDEAAGIYDDGSYNEGKYGDDQYNSNNYNSANNFNNENSFNNGDFNSANINRDLSGNDGDSIVTDSAAFRTNQGSRGFDGATKAYLPPVQTKRSQGRNGPESRSRSRPSFNARDGYNY